MLQYLGLGEWGSVWKSVFIPTAAPQNLTVDGAVRVVEGIEDWRLQLVWHSLRVPDSKCSEIVKDVITYWITTDPFPSWRRLMYALDENGEEIADSIRHCAEPLAGTSFELSDRQHYTHLYILSQNNFKTGICFHVFVVI